MKDTNNLTILGRLTRDPEIKQVGDSQLANFNIAVNDGKKEKPLTYFFDCEIWGKQAELLAQYSGKGKQVLLVGRLKQESWDNPEGKKSTKVKIKVESFQLIGGKMEQAEPKPVDYNQSPDEVF